jgi:hypothetical protein
MRMFYDANACTCCNQCDLCGLRERARDVTLGSHSGLNGLNTVTGSWINQNKSSQKFQVSSCRITYTSKHTCVKTTHVKRLLARENSGRCKGWVGLGGVTIAQQ